MADGNGPASDDRRYAVALEEARLSVGEQAKAFDALRTRATSLLAAAGVITGLLVGFAFNRAGAEPSGTWGWISISVALGSFAGVVVATLLILWPSSNWVFVRSGRILVESYIEEPEPPLTYNELQRELTLKIDDHYRANRARLNRLHLTFAMSIVLLALQVGALFLTLLFY